MESIIIIIILIALDLTTNRAEFRAYLVSSPTLFDLDGDGSRDIIVGTAVGFLYAINHEGIIRKNFPITMDEIHTQVLVGDFQNTGQILLIAIDRNGNIVAFNKEGQEVFLLFFIFYFLFFIFIFYFLCFIAC